MSPMVSGSADPSFWRQSASRAAAVMAVMAVMSTAIGVQSPIAPEPCPTGTIVARCGAGFLEEIDGHAVLHVAGSPYEIGFQHGRLLRDRVHAVMRYLLDEKVKDMKIEVAGLPVVGPQAVIQWIQTTQQQFLPRWYEEELQGLADGSGVPLADIRTCNFIPELFHCSGFAVSGAATGNGHTYHGRVLDYGCDWKLQEHPVIVVAKPEGNIPFINIGYAGFIGCVTGINAERVSIGEMGGAGLGRWQGVPMAILMREALQRAATLADAVAIFRDSPRTCEYFYVVADGKTGEAVAMEAGAERFETVTMGAANEQLPQAVPDAVLLSAGERYDLLVKRVRAAHGGIDSAAAMELMSRPVAMESNLHNVLFETSTGRFWVAHASAAGAPAADQRYRGFDMRALLARECDPDVPALPTADLHAPGQFEHHPDIALELWAAEPQVVDPVAASFAADGSCYVVEMRDYPFGAGPDRQPGGTIRRLRDTDGDGRADESVVFATELSFPTSVLAWRRGVLVLAPPNFFYLEDTDGDGVADLREKVIEGVALGVTDSNANSLRFGLDGRVHAANGGNGGRLRFPDTAAAPVVLGKADVALCLGRREIHRTFQTAGGFGLVTDAAGHRFATYNIDYLQQQILPIDQLETAGDVAAFAATHNISDHGPSAQLFPIVTAATRVNHPEQAGRFSSAGGMGFLEGSPFSPRLARSVFVCDVVTNLVHRDLVREDGPTFRAGRAPEEQACEFIASRDPACRPIGLEHGPDGALYLLDMQRDVIEHPDYIPAATRATLDIRAGCDRGRIYRIVPRDGLPPAGPPLAELADEDLVAELGHPFRWRRETAHRLLADAVDVRDTIQRAAAPAVGGLEARFREALTHAPLPEARLRAGWLLAGAGCLSGDDLTSALADASPDVRENAVAWLRKHPDPGMRLVAMLDDSHPRVRFTAALALDGMAVAGKAAALGRMLERDVEHAWSRRAVALAADDEATDLLAGAWRAAGRSDDDAWRKAVGELAFTAASAATRRESLGTLLDSLDPGTAPGAAQPLVVGLLAGWLRHPDAIGDQSQLAARVAVWSGDIWLACGGSSLVGTLLDLAELAGGPLPMSLAERVSAARTILAEGRPARLPAGERLCAVEILARAPGPEVTEELVAVLARPEPTEIQRAAIAGLLRRSRSDLGEQLVAAWPLLGPAVRPQVVALLVSDRRHHSALLNAVDTRAIGLGELNLDLEQRRTLLRQNRPDLAARATRLLGDEEYANRRPLVTEWLACMPAEGDRATGREVFRQRCGSCHAAHGVGHRVGPDLESLSHRSVEDLVSHILDPNMAINPGYVSCVVELEDGRSLTGLLAVDAADAVTILQPEAKRVTVPRSEIADVRMLSMSLMPEGFERIITPADLRDVIAFIQAR